MFAAFLDRSDALLEQWYKRTGSWAGAMVISVILVLVVWLYVDGGKDPISHGALYAAISEAPFDVSDGNPLRNRIFAPLVGWVLHLRGPLFVVVPWAFLVGFVAIVNVWSRREGAGATLALAITLTMAFSPVTMHSLVAPGFVEAVSYFLLVMALMNVRYMIASCAFMALAIMTHEASAFLVPAWLLFAGRGEWRSWLERVLLLLLFLLPYAVYRQWVHHHDDGVLSATYYFSTANVMSCLAVGPLPTVVGVFAVFRFHWLVLAVALFLFGLRNFRVQWALLLIASISVTLLIAYDTTRMFCWTFPVFVIGAVGLGERIGRNRAVALVLMLWVLNFLIPPYTTTGAESYPLIGIRTYVQ